MNEESVEVEEVVEDTKETFGSTIASKVAERIGAIGPEVNERVIETLTERELEKRANLIVAKNDELVAFKKELNKIKPDVGGSFLEDGTEVKATSYSKAKFEERKKLLEKIAKYEKALTLACVKGDMSKLNDLANVAK